MIKVKKVVFFISYIIGLVGFISVAKYVNPVFSLSFLVMLLVGGISDFKKGRYLPRLMLNIFSLIVVLFLAVRVSLENMVIPVVETLLLLLGIKFLEKKEFRDFMQIYVISIFLLAGSALLSINITFMLYFFVIFFGVVISVILLTYYSQDKNISFDRETFRKLILNISLIPIAAIPVTALIFTVLPRTEYPVFNFLNTSGKGKTGFSDTVQLGDVSEIQEDSAVALRIKTDKKLDLENTYIRGITLNFFDGKRWYRRNLYETSFVKGGETVEQEIIVEPTGNRFLFAVDVPVKIFRKDVKLEGDRVFVSYRRIFSRVKYRAISKYGGYIVSSDLNINDYLQLPSHLDKNIVELARRLKGKNAIETVVNVVKYLKRNYHYTLKNLSVSNNSLSSFLFEKKAGNCEFFASAGAVLLRINKIPTRLVAGYRGVRYNEVGDYYIVPNRYAHTWIEVYIDGKWVRYDPTPSVPVSKNDGKNPIIDRIKKILDAVEYAYINSIVDFNVKKQIATFQYIGNMFYHIKSLFIYGIYLGITIVILFLLFKALRQFRLPYEKKVLNMFLKKMEQYGYTKKENEGLEEFVDRIDENRLREKALQFVVAFENVYYRDKKIDKNDYKRLISIIRDI